MLAGGDPEALRDRIRRRLKASAASGPDAIKALSKKLIQADQESAVVSRLDLIFAPVKKRVRVERHVSHGHIALRPDPLIFKVVNRAERI